MLLVHDFSQNLLLYAQDEVSAAHWDHEQVTLHPTVVYYVGPCGKMIKEEVIHMTNNRKHIEKTVAVFQKKTIEFLKATFSTIEDLASYCTDNYEWQVECSDHCEGEKSPKTDKIHNLRKIIYYPNIDPKGIDKINTVDGTRKIHSVCNTGMKGVLEKRMFTCCCEKCMFGVGECAFPDYSDEWKLVSVLGKRHLKTFVKSEGVGAIQKWCNTKTKSIRSQNQVSNLKRDECNPKSNVQKSARQKLSMVESDINVSKIKLSASNTATTADAPFILDQKHGHCDPESNVRKSARRKFSMVESDINILKIESSASNTATKTTKSTASHTAMKTASTIATKAATTADGPFNWKKMLDKLHKAHSYDNNNNNNNNNNRLFPICLQISCFDHLYFLIPVSENGLSLNLVVIF